MVFGLVHSLSNIDICLNCREIFPKIVVDEYLNISYISAIRRQNTGGNKNLINFECKDITD